MASFQNQTAPRHSMWRPTFWRDLDCCLFGIRATRTFPRQYGQGPPFLRNPPTELSGVPIAPAAAQRAVVVFSPRTLFSKFSVFPIFSVSPDCSVSRVFRFRTFLPASLFCSSGTIALLLLENVVPPVTRRPIAARETAVIPVFSVKAIAWAPVTHAGR